MANFNYLAKLNKSKLIDLVINNVEKECGKLMFTAWNKLHRRLNRENKVVLTNLIIIHKQSSMFMADIIKSEIKYNIDNL